MTQPKENEVRPSAERLHPAKKRPVLLIITLASVLAASLAAYLIFRDRGKENVPAAVAHKTPPAESAIGAILQEPALPPVWAKALRLTAPCSELKVIIPAGQTFAGILAGQGLGPSEVQNILERTRDILNPKSVQAGREMRFYRDPEGRTAVIDYDRSESDFLRLRRQGDGFQAQILSHPVEIRRCVLEGRIEDSLIGAFNRAGEGDFLALDFAEVFAWDVDFYIDPQKGDRFRVLFEKRWMYGRPAGYGQIQAAEYRSRDRLLEAFLFTYPDTGRPDYFDAAGNSLRKEFLKSPLKFGRITSRFTSSRYHPIRKIYRAHYAIDYAAPVGTPVRATADGEVLAAGWNGGAGRMVKIKHKNGYQSQYLHLSGFGEGVRVGAKVVGGQVIGYVGSTGESTGPHLDYRLHQHGKPINPLGARFQPAEPLRPQFRDAFRRETAEYRLVRDMESFPRQALARLADLWGRVYTLHLSPLF